jgi:anti-sigma B factor antagonist
MPNGNIQIVTSSGTRDGYKILHVKGPLNIHTIFDFQTALRAETSPTVIIDFAEVPFIDSTGLGAMVGAHLAAEKANRKLAFAALNSQVKALLDMTHVSKFFRTYPTVQDAETAGS